jgi:pimeloyl-ACP methyl ester carboxylesterase
MTKTDMTSLATKHEILIKDSHLSYWAYNTGRQETIVMLHGFRGNHLGLADIISFLPHYNIIVPDLPGLGASTAMPNIRHDVDGYASCVEELIGKLKLHQPVLAGHSFGTLVAAKIAVDHPSLISKLVLISPIATPQITSSPPILMNLTRLFYWFGCKLPTKLGQRVLASRLFVRALCYLLVKTPDKQVRESVYAHHLNNIDPHHNMRVIDESFGSSITQGVVSKAAKIQNPTLVITGACDNMVPVATQKQLADALPKGELVIIPDVGHLAHLEAPEAIAKAIESFLK